MRPFFLALLLLALAVAHGRPMAASPAASKQSVKSRWAAAAAPASAPWKSSSATSMVAAQYDALEPQGDVVDAPVDTKEEVAYAVAEIVAEVTGSAEEARNAAEIAIGE